MNISAFGRCAAGLLAGAAVLFAVAATHALGAGDGPVGDWNSSLNTFSTAGKGEPILNGCKESTLLSHKGKGCLTHMWFGGEWAGYEKTRIRVYVDGETTPSIDMELGMGHGVGFGDSEGPWGNSRMGETGAASGIYNTYRIPYGVGIRVTAQRSRESPDGGAFWWIIRGTDGLRVVLGDVRLPANARLKLYKITDVTAKPLEELTMCDVKGTGALYEVAIAAQGLTDTVSWHALSFMEGCIRAYFNGSPSPQILSSGYEDYFTGTYYFQKGRFANSLAGVTHLDPATRTVSAYRFHDEDPIFFQKGIRLTCRNGDTEHAAKEGPAVGGPPATQFTTYAWVYQW